MSSASAGRPRLLFVVSRDYGELSSALYLIAGGAFDVVLLLPAELFALNRESLPTRAQPYATLADVIQTVDRERPDLVFLFSGYLYAINRLLTLEEINDLVGALQARKCRMVTSDPFLGILSRLEESTISERHPHRRALSEHFAQLAALFADQTHLYLVDPGRFAPRRAASFFNSNILVEPSQRSVPGKKRWLFVLSREDYEGQAALWGAARFETLLLAWLTAAVRAGRQAVVVAPAQGAASLQQKVPRSADLMLLPFCGHLEFSAQALEAEYAFYWNVFSNSILPRMVNYLPVFIFDPGHLARAIPLLFEAGIERYYAGQEPPYLDLREPSVERLADLAAAREPAVTAALQVFRQSPSPREMIEKLMSEP